MLPTSIRARTERSRSSRRDTVTCRSSLACLFPPAGANPTSAAWCTARPARETPRHGQFIEFFVGFVLLGDDRGPCARRRNGKERGDGHRVGIRRRRHRSRPCRLASRELLGASWSHNSRLGGTLSC